MYSLAQEQALLARLEARRSSAGITFDPLSLAFGPQRGFLADPAQYRLACTTRRAGKTFAACLMMLSTALREPGSTVVYLSTTRTRAQKTVWDDLKRMNASHGLGGEPNESDLCMRLGGSRIYVSGGESKKHVDRWRGISKISLFILDEAQDWADEVLDYVIASVAMPALADISGRIVIAGTPGPLPRGLFHAATLSDTWSRHSWSLFMNPHLRSAQDELAHALRIRGVDEGDPTIQREFFGRWVVDTQALVFGCLADANRYVELPAIDGWRYVVGIDFGFVDMSAIVVLAWRAGDDHLYEVEAQAWSDVGPTETMCRLRDIIARYRATGSLAGAVGDPGGGGKGMLADLHRMHGIFIESAVKTEKVSAVRHLADAIRTRSLLMRSQALLDDLMRPEWDPDARGVRLRGHMPDRVDALLYATRKAVAMGAMAWRAPVAPEGPHEALFRQIAKEDAEMERLEAEAWM